MCGFRFQSSLKKWPAWKASGPERHLFDSAKQITTPLIPKHPESGCCAWRYVLLVPWRYRMFQMLRLDYNLNRHMMRTQVVWRWQRSNPNNLSTHHVRFCFLEENWKYQIPVRTGDLDKTFSQSHWIIKWCGGDKCRTKTWHCKLYSINWRSCQLVMENHCCSSYYLEYAVYKKGVSRQHMTFTSCQNAACSDEFFLQRVDYEWANVHHFCCLLHTEKSWHAYRFSAAYFWLARFAPWYESRAFSLTSFERQISSLWLNKLLGCLIFSKVPPGSE